jgi:hypothetical protein
MIGFEFLLHKFSSIVRRSVGSRELRLNAMVYRMHRHVHLFSRHRHVSPDEIREALVKPWSGTKK